ncbi:DUF1345 domain-containing protein [Deinococcus aerophilus]|uniref:DUF1345 domain-containing protein n=1 Tax=Deinococcus aerophilus TaxID=522488 RepID=A0ABQ2GTK3_9DEIO|nr:DUF1345 domain-containing protein [Deinococcus aerophilus]GGM12792.1 hypothetical protein GCM10010841_21680 [Deinococcus aerophilus]
MTTAERVPHAVFRPLLGAVVGAGVGLLTPAAWPWEARVLVGWVAFCAAVLGQLWPLLGSATPQRTRALALREDDTRALAGGLTLTAALVSLVGVIFTLHQASGEKGPGSIALTALAVLTVAASWLLVHTEYVLHYARLFYTGGGGVAFPREPDGTLDDPDYRDFAYLSFTIGMTFQVSDTAVTSRAFRRLLLGHAVLSYVFGTVIVAVTINGVAGLIG